MAFSVKGKTAIVTGAGSGINFSFVQLLLKNGCNCVIADLALRPEAQVVVDKHSTGSGSSARAVFQKTDVTDWVQLERMFDVAEKEFGEIDIVCPGAGVYEPHFSNFWYPPGSSESRDSPEGSRYASLDINLTHPIRATQLAISRFLGAKTPKSIVHISSIAAQKPFLAAPVYVATKHAINGFVRSLARLEEEAGIRVTAVAPGVIKTPLWTEHPEKLKMVNEETDGWVTPEEVAEVMLALVQRDVISDADGMRTDDGKTISIAGGTILEVSKVVREVTAYNDPGPGNREGNTVTDSRAVEQDALNQLAKPGWGKTGH
ncbi:hypothetical protein FQN54_005437 [Arachnomyces sp. PD_36]|nr:hypothetical protein FQN54_005437 [Arachnomyces sp. PD_36]